MDYFNFITSMVAFVENRLNDDIDHRSLEKSFGYSTAHIREIFRDSTKISLSKYILYRKICNAAFEIAHNKKRTILDIAAEYGFESYDTFTRAFKRYLLMTPKDFRKSGIPIGRIRLGAGVYGPGVIKNVNSLYNPPDFWEEFNMAKDIKKSEESCILYGVPRVKYCYEECTPFPSALKACLNYMGQDISYSYLMAVSGAAFRLRWNTREWDGGNVDIMCIYEKATEAFKKSFKAAGRAFNMLERTEKVTKEDFISFIKAEIDEGRPVIALGIIGPPEACIVTGYRDDGHTLLGWNFFQEYNEYAKDIEIDESGYFISKNWWDNPCTIGLISIGEDQGQQTPTKEILQNAIDILTKKQIGVYAGGQAAYDHWANSLLDETQFPRNAVMPMLFERIMCHSDATCMIGEGRYYGAAFLEWLGDNNEPIKEKCYKAAKYFKQEFTIARKMGELIEENKPRETQAKKLGEPLVRKELAKCIMEAKRLDYSGCEVLREIVEII